jgi:hypothetical protein
MMHSGRDGAKVLVWPASHNTVTKLDWMKRNQTEVNDSGLQTMSRRDMERLGTDFFQQQKCQILGGAIHRDFIVVHTFARNAQLNRDREA